MRSTSGRCSISTESEKRAYIAVLDMPEIVARATFDRKYEGIAKFPAVSRDISMVVPKQILVGRDRRSD